MQEVPGTGALGPHRARTLSTAVHALEALEFIAQKPRGAPVKAIAHGLGVSLSSAYSLINSLRAEGFVEDSPAGRGLYVMGPRILQLYHSYVVANTLPERFQPVLEVLRDRASARAYAAGWKHRDLEVGEVIGKRGARELADVSKGFRGAAHALALGKIYLAEIPEEKWPPYLQTPIFSSFTKHTIRTRAELRHNLAAVRERGLAFDLEEYKDGVSCIAGPVKDANGRVVAAVGISMPARRLKAQPKALARAVRDAATAASEAVAQLLGDSPILHE